MKLGVLVYINEFLDTFDNQKPRCCLISMQESSYYFSWYGNGHFYFVVTLLNIMPINIQIAYYFVFAIEKAHVVSE